MPDSEKPVSVSLLTAMAAIMGEVQAVAKRGKNEFHRYDYATAADIMHELKPLLAKHGLLIFQTETERQFTEGGLALMVTYQFTLAHVSGEVWQDRPTYTGMARAKDTKGGFDDKAVNKCHTTARKYFLLGLFQIPTGDYPEADGDETPKAAPAASTATVKPATTARKAEPPPHDPETGEIGPHRIAVHALEDGSGTNWKGWAALLLQHCNRAESEAELDEWLAKNETPLKNAREASERLAEYLDKSLATARKGLQQVEVAGV